MALKANLCFSFTGVAWFYPVAGCLAFVANCLPSGRRPWGVGGLILFTPGLLSERSSAWRSAQSFDASARHAEAHVCFSGTSRDTFPAYLIGCFMAVRLQGVGCGYPVFVTALYLARHDLRVCSVERLPRLAVISLLLG